MTFCAAVRTLTVFCTLLFTLLFTLPTFANNPTPPDRPKHLEAHPDAVEIALNCACASRNNKARCREEREQEIREKLSDLLWITDIYKDKVPKAMRPILASIACGESSFRIRPTCGADPECMKECGTGHACIVQCGGIERCNDRGTSAGMFQMKRKDELAKLFERTYKVPFDPFDYKTIANYYMIRIIYGTENYVPAACGRLRLLDRWDAAVFRIGRGPILVPGRKAERKCAPSVRGSADMTNIECIFIPARKAVPRCKGSKYARRAVQWYKRAPHAWTLIERDNVAQGEENTVSN